MGIGAGIGKKGFMLTLLAIVLSGLFVTIFSARLTNPPDYKTDVVESRITMMDYYLESFFDYAASVGQISGYAALQGIISDIGARGDYNYNFTTEFPYCMMYGNLTPSRACPGMGSRTFGFYLANLSDDAFRELNVITQYTINNVTVSPTRDPFYLRVLINMTVNISDNGIANKSIANFSANRLVDVEVPIYGLSDPVYLVGSGGAYVNYIEWVNYSKPETGWIASDLDTLYNTSSYRNTQYGVTFFHRIQGNFTTAEDAFSFNATNTTAYLYLVPTGIESFIDPNNPAASGLVSANVSFVDYLFWNRTAFDCTQTDPYQVMGIRSGVAPDIPDSPVHYQLDRQHVTAFNLTSNVSMTDNC